MAMISREIPLGDAMAVVIAKNAAIVGTVKGQGIFETVGPKVGFRDHPGLYLYPMPRLGDDQYLAIEVQQTFQTGMIRIVIHL